MKKEHRRFLRQLEQLGWQVTYRRSGHCKLVSPTTGRAYFTGTTPSDARAFRNLKADLRRIGPVPE